MFPYFGQKKRLSKEYPEPKYNTIIEPFAGSAGYSMRYHTKNVILCEKDERLYDIWDYIINKAKPSRILKFPILKHDESLKDSKFSWLKPVEIRLIGYFLGSCRAIPGYRPSKYGMYNRWNEKSRKELSENIKKVKHWRIINGSYENIYNYKNATWFIDPPYQGKGGKSYRLSNKQIDYKQLSKWCKSRNGEVIVCENEEAKWLPFKPLIKLFQNGNKHTEMIWYKT